MLDSHFVTRFNECFFFLIKKKKKKIIMFRAVRHNRCSLVVIYSVANLQLLLVR